MQAEPGAFYAIGIGPGAADLLTVRAVDILRSVDIVIAPRSQVSKSSLALEAVRGYLGENQQVVEEIYPMNRDDVSTREFWSEVAGRAAKWCADGKSVAQITLGDPLIYSTSAYLLDAVAGLLPNDKIVIVPGISAFQAAGAKFGEPLCLQEDRLCIIPGSDLGEVAAALETCETLVIFKAGKNLESIRELLRGKNLLDKSSAAFYVEQSSEALWQDMSVNFDHSGKYMTIVLVRKGHRSWSAE